MSAKTRLQKLENRQVAGKSVSFRVGIISADKLTVECNGETLTMAEWEKLCEGCNVIHIPDNGRDKDGDA